MNDMILRRLHTVIDAELDLLATSADPPDSDEPERERHEIRLRSLRGAVVAVELYNEGRART